MSEGTPEITEHNVSKDSELSSFLTESRHVIARRQGMEKPAVHFFFFLIKIPIAPCLFNLLICLLFKHSREFSNICTCLCSRKENFCLHGVDKETSYVLSLMCH